MSYTISAGKLFVIGVLVLLLVLFINPVAVYAHGNHHSDYSRHKTTSQRSCKQEKKPETPVVPVQETPVVPPQTPPAVVLTDTTTSGEILDAASTTTPAPVVTTAQAELADTGISTVIVSSLAVVTMFAAIFVATRRRSENQ